MNERDPRIVAIIPARHGSVGLPRKNIADEDIGHGKFDTFCIFEPTSPLRRKETLLRCFEKYYSAEAEALITVCASTENFGRLRTDGKFVGLDPGIARRRQEREPLFKEAGVIYIRDVEAFQREQVVIPNEPTAYIVLPEEAILA